MSRKGIIFRSFLLIVLFGIIYAVLIEPNWIKIEVVNVPCDSLKSSLSGLRIVHISDTEIGKIGYRERKAVSKIREIGPDIIFMTGDYVSKDYSPQAVQWFFDNLTAKVGIWAVFGNKDYDSPGFISFLTSETMKGIFRKNNIRILKNSWEKLVAQKKWHIKKEGSTKSPKEGAFTNKRSGCVHIVGIDDPITGRADVPRAFSGVPDNALKIVLVHSPNTWEKTFRFKPCLTLAGHTQGGQIPFFYVLLRTVSNTITYDVVYLKGLFTDNNMSLYVNRGLGTNRNFPVRLGCRPEITQLVF
jgi:predicted MPP superfamily phosphohydrolase